MSQKNRETQGMSASHEQNGTHSTFASHLICGTQIKDASHTGNGTHSIFASHDINGTHFLGAMVTCMLTRQHTRAVQLRLQVLCHGGVDP